MAFPHPTPSAGSVLAPRGTSGGCQGGADPKIRVGSPMPSGAVRPHDRPMSRKSAPTTQQAATGGRGRRLRWTAATLVALTTTLGLALVESPAGAVRPLPDRPEPRPETPVLDETARDDDQPSEPRAVRVARYGELAFEVDESLRPHTPSVEPLGRDTSPRPVGAVVTAEGERSEFVLDEVVVRADTATELADFVGRWNGTVLDSDELDEDGHWHLVRVDPSAADVAGLPANLLAEEPEHVGTHRTSSTRALQLVAMAAQELAAGTPVAPAWVSEADGIADGQVFEHPDRLSKDVLVPSGNVFDWTGMRAGGLDDIGVATAWQLLEAKGKLDASPTVMVSDGGFRKNNDLPDDAIIHRADWNDENGMSCSGGGGCPWHGTQVAMAAMAKVDNDYGVAGPAGALDAKLIAVGAGGDSFTRIRRLEDLVDQYRPDVLNMSWSWKTWAFKDVTQSAVSKRFKRMQEDGTLVLSSAGNEGRNVDDAVLILPCESSRVTCVGGTIAGDEKVDPYSNYSSVKSDTGVEIYAPYCMPLLSEPHRPWEAMSYRCGTSYSAPFVAGIAALVRAADPSISPAELRFKLLDTAHYGGLGAKVTGWQYRVDAFAAVADTLEIVPTPPQVDITQPVDGFSYGVDQWFDFAANVSDYRGYPLPVQWSSNIDGNLGNPTMGTLHWTTLSPGTHTITATARDFRGTTGGDSITIEVADQPATIKVLAPSQGGSFPAGHPIQLSGTTYDPDWNGPVPDDQVKWVVRRSNNVIHSTTGHSALLPGNKVLAGHHTATMTVGGVSQTRNFFVTVPVGAAPQAHIVSPPDGKVFHSLDLDPVTVQFEGYGWDNEDGPVPGTRYRWKAIGENTSKVLCTGTNVPGLGGKKGFIVTPVDCTKFEAQLELQDGAIGDSVWSIVLEVWDSAGNKTTKVHTVKVRYTEG